MRRGSDIAKTFPGLFLVHHNKPGGHAAAHSHPEHHLIIPLQGEVSVELADRKLGCGPGRMLYIEPNTAHAFRSANDKGERLICMIDPVVWKKAGAELVGSAVLPASQLCKELLFYLLMHPDTKNAGALIDTFVRTLAELLVIPRLQEAAIEHAIGSVSRPELRKALVIARERCTADLKVTDLAKLSGLSVRNLARLFQIELGLSPKQLLVSLRIEKSQELLQSGHSVTDTAMAVGYSSLSQFIQTFQKITGQAPSEFARSGQNGRNPQ